MADLLGGSAPAPGAAASSASGALLTSLRAPFCGRDLELGLLTRLATEAAEARQVRFCLVTGSPGVGKTRLLRELAQALQTRVSAPYRVFSGSILPEGAPPLAALSEQLLQRFLIDLRDGGPSARDKLLRGCRSLLPGVRATEVAHLLGDMMRLPFPESAVTEPRPGQRPEPRLYLALKRVWSADAARGPIALLFDNVEQATPELVNLLHYLAAGLTSVPVLLCAFARPDVEEAHPSFGEGEVPCERLQLAPLIPKEAVALLWSLTRDAGEPPPALCRHVEQRLSGLPRIVVELVRLLRETGVLKGSRTQGASWDIERLRRLVLPEDLAGLVAARLHAMDPTQRAVLEKAAVCGEHFFVEAVVALTRCAESGLGMPGLSSDSLPPGVLKPPTDPDGPTLEEIVVAGDRASAEISAVLKTHTEAGLVQPLSHSSVRGEVEYRFAYPPLREVIYESLDPTLRRRFHGVYAQWLALTPDGRQEEIQESIGRHLERAGRGDVAAQAYRRAAELCRERYAHARTTRLLARAIACLGTVDVATRINLWQELGSAFEQKGDSESALAAFEKVVRLSWVVASRDKAALALLSIGRLWRNRGDLQLAMDYLTRAQGLFSQAQDGAGVADARDGIGQLLCWRGRFTEALDHCAAALEVRRRLGVRRKVASSLMHIGDIERHRGLLAEAHGCYKEALQIRQQEGHKSGVASTQDALGVLSFLRGDDSNAKRLWEEGLALTEETGATAVRIKILGHLGELYLLQGQLPEAEAQLQLARSLAQELGDRRLTAEVARILGQLRLRMEDQPGALALCEEALAQAREAGVPVTLGRTLLALGEVHGATLFDGNTSSSSESNPGDDVDDDDDGVTPARRYYRRAVALFRDVGDPVELANALYRQARYHIERGAVERGQALLSEAGEIATRLELRLSQEVEAMLQDL